MTQDIFSLLHGEDSSSKFPAILIAEDIPALLRLKEKELLLRHTEALDLFDTSHASADTENLEKATRRIVKRDLITLRRVLNEDIGTSAIEPAQRELLCAKCDALLNGANELSQRLIEDKHNLKQKEEKETFDLVKLFSYMLVIPYASYNMAKVYITSNADFDKSVPIAVAGIGLSFHFRKNLKAAWKAASKNVTPRKIGSTVKSSLKRSFMLYYLRESAKNCLQGSVKTITHNAAEISRQTNRLIRGNKRPNDPNL